MDLSLKIADFLFKVLFITLNAFVKIPCYRYTDHSKIIINLFLSLEEGLSKRTPHPSTTPSMTKYSHLNFTSDVVVNIFFLREPEK